MDIVTNTFFENSRKYWRRRRYRRLDDGKKRMKITRLGNKTSRRVWRIKVVVPKLRIKIVSPMNLIAKFHDAYVDTMIRLVGGGRHSHGTRNLKGKPVPMLTANNEVVDSRLVLEIYKRLVSTRELAALLV